MNRKIDIKEILIRLVFRKWDHILENLKENESKDIGVLLSIIISTYNRKELVVGNISKMLECNRRDIEFIVGDNASSDGTFEEFSKIKDDTISLY